jgi:hypothetical protein
MGIFRYMCWYMNTIFSQIFRLLQYISGAGQRSQYSDWLWAGRPMGPSSSPGVIKNTLHVVHAGTEAHPASQPG